MTPDNAISLIHRRCGNRSGLDSVILEELNNAMEQEQVMDELPWFLITQSSGVVCVADTPTLAVPTGFLRELEHDEYGLWIQTISSGAWSQLVKDSYKYLKAKYSTSTASLPLMYDLIGTNFHFFPTPDLAYPLDFAYYAEDDAIEAGSTENLWMKHAPMVLVARAGMEVANYVGNERAYDWFAGEYKDARGMLQRNTVARKEAGLVPFRRD